MNKKFTVLIPVFLLVALFFGFINSNDDDPLQGKRNTDSRMVKYNFVPKISYHSPNAILKYVDSLNGDNSITGLEARGYKTYYRSGGSPGITQIWFQGDPASIGFSAYNGPTTGFLQADYNCVLGANNIDNWLVLPKLNVITGDSLFFFSGSYNAATYYDSIRVMYSAVGDSLPEAGSWVELGRFRLTSFLPNSVVPWAENGFRAPTGGANGRFAIRYCVADGGPTGANSSTIGVDYIRVASSVTYPLNAFNLQTPAANATITSIPNSSTPVSITWDTSSSSATYKWIYGTALPTRLHTIPTGTNSITMTLGQLDVLLGTLGLAQGDSISGSWDVWAFRNNAPLNDSLKSVNGPRTLKLKRQKPVLTAFNLISPIAGARVLTAAGNNTPILFNWSKSGAGTTYKMYYASPNFSSPSNIKFKLPANNSGYDSLVTTTSNDMDGILSGIGVAMGDSTVGQWRTYAYSGSDSLASTQSNNITFKRLPIATACIGTGTTSTSYPFYTLYEDSRTQLLYTAAEITAAGGARGLINRLGFTILTVGAPAMSNFSVKMQTITASTISTWTTSGWAEVFTSSGYTPPGTGLQYIDLSTEYYWNGTGNLLVEVCYDNATWTGNSTVAGTAQTGTVVHYHNDGLAGCTMTGTSTAETRPNVCLVINTATSVDPIGTTVPQVYSLSQNYPNPFNPVTKINFAIPQQGFVTLKIYDVLGREVKTLVNEVKTIGRYTVDFNASEFSSGVYFYRLQSQGFTDIKKMMLIK